jgi:hypothetical protein
LNIREIGKVFGFLISAHQATQEPFARKRIEDAMVKLSEMLEQKPEIYRDFIEGIMDSGLPLKLLVNVWSFLPGKPKIAEFVGRAEGFFVTEGKIVKTIIGLDENGKFLVNTMVAAVRERKKESVKKPENQKKPEG